jgi:3-oxoacyl-[acyl-carrier-protein] synthase-3
MTAGTRIPSEVSGIGLRATSYFLPPSISIDTYASLANVPAAQRDQLSMVHGLRCVHVAEGYDPPLEMAVQAVSGLFEKQDVDPLSIDALIVFHTVTYMSFEPHALVEKLRKHLGLKRATGFSVNGQNCASPISALRVARNLIMTGAAKTVLLVGADYFLGSMQRMIEDFTVQGDAASAALVQANCETNRIIAINTYTDGSLFKGIDAGPHEWEQFNISYYLASRRLILDSLRRVSLSIDDIALIIPHNTNIPSWRKLLAILKVGEDRLYGENIKRCGHVCSSDLMVNFTDAVVDRRINKGDYVLMFTVGIGSVWACAVLQC